MPDTKSSESAPHRGPGVFPGLLLAEALWGFVVTWVLARTHDWYGLDLSGTRLGQLIFLAALGVSGYVCGTLHPKQAWLFGIASAVIPIFIQAGNLIRDVQQSPT